MKKALLPIGILIVILSCLLIVNTMHNEEGDSMTYPLFLNELHSNNISSAVIAPNTNHIQITLLSNGTSYIVDHPKTETFIEDLLKHNVTIEYTTDNAPIQTIQILLFISIGVFIFLIVNIKNAKSFEVSNNKEEPQVTLSHVAGNVEAKAMVADIISFIKDPDKYATVGASMPKGLLLYGPPGTGKTLMAKAIAGEAGVPFYAMSGSDFVQMYVGVGASRIRTLFQKAKKHEKAVIFIDEIDAIGKKRSKNPNTSNDERDQTLNALLTEMSGFHERTGIIVVAATNRLDTLDEALLRPGRFDRQIEIGLPDINARQRILSHYMKNKPFSKDVNLKELAESTIYFSGAMLENLINEAAIQAANESQSIITKEHLDTAFYTVIAGSPKMDRSYISMKEREVTAYHEAGHALITNLLQSERKISKVTIIPSVKGAAGFNLSIPKDSMYQTNTQILSNIKVYLAGRCAEELIYGESSITTGASNDIEKASTLLYQYYNLYGMDKDIGMFSTALLSESPDQHLIQTCRNHMNQLYNETLELLRDNEIQLRLITQELLDKESISGDDIIRICA